MIFGWKKCETCVHNDVCGMKGQYETLIQKIQNVDKNKPYSGFDVRISCTSYRNDDTNHGNTIEFAVRD